MYEKPTPNIFNDEILNAFSRDWEEGMQDRQIKCKQVGKEVKLFIFTGTIIYVQIVRHPYKSHINT